MGHAILCGSCVVDLPCLTVPLDRAIGEDEAHAIEPIVPSLGGITCNTGIALSRLGVSVTPLTYVGKDIWGSLIRSTFEEEGISTKSVLTHPQAPTTAVAVLIDEQGRRSFLAPNVRTATKDIDAAFVIERLSSLKADYFILGYYGRMPRLEPDLPSVLSKIRESGCRTIMDSAGDGGDPDALSKALPHLDIYIPSEAEASRQTQTDDPKAMVQWFRQWNDHGILGVKLGERGALLHSPQGDYIELPAIQPPSPIIDTTGAGDCFTAGLIAGLDQGLSLAESGRWATAAGSLAVTARGGYHGITNRGALEALLVC